jgi:hypothetical protein
MKDYKITATTDAAARFTKAAVVRSPARPSHAVGYVQRLGAKRTYAQRRAEPGRPRPLCPHQAAQEYLISLFGMTGKLITPKEAEFFYRRENEPMVRWNRFLPDDQFYSATEPSEADLQDFFTKHEAEYRLPDRVQINYIVFEPSNYLAKADQLLGTNMDDKS